MKSFIKRLFCRHQFKFIRNLYGDEIVDWDYKRSTWHCVKCGKVEARDSLYHVPVEKT